MARGWLALAQKEDIEMARHSTHGGARMVADSDQDMMKLGGRARRARGGAAGSDGEAPGEKDKGSIQVYNAQGSKVMSNAEDETPDFKKGGRAKKRADGGVAEGAMEQQRMDRRPRRAAGGRAAHSPYSSASAFQPPATDRAGKGYEGESSKRGT